MEPVFFISPSALRKWYEENHSTAAELVVGYYKRGTRKETITWSQSVDEAICFGWIDGVRRSIDEESYSIRFTPRRPGSAWSAINIQKAEEMTGSGKMHPAGLEAFSRRKESRSRIYTYEINKEFRLTESMVDQFMQNKNAWKYFHSQAPSYRKVTIRWVLSAKQEATRLKRLDELITSSEAGEWIKAMRWGKKAATPKE